MRMMVYLPALGISPEEVRHDYFSMKLQHKVEGSLGEEFSGSGFCMKEDSFLVITGMEDPQTVTQEAGLWNSRISHDFSEALLSLIESASNGDLLCQAYGWPFDTVETDLLCRTAALLDNRFSVTEGYGTIINDGEAVLDHPALYTYLVPYEITAIQEHPEKYAVVDFELECV